MPLTEMEKRHKLRKYFLLCILFDIYYEILIISATRFDYELSNV